MAVPRRGERILSGGRLRRSRRDGVPRILTQLPSRSCCLTTPIGCLKGSVPLYWDLGGKSLSSPPAQQGNGPGLVLRLPGDGNSPGTERLKYRDHRGQLWVRPALFEGLEHAGRHSGSVSEFGLREPGENTGRGEKARQLEHAGEGRERCSARMLTAICALVPATILVNILCLSSSNHSIMYRFL